MTLLKTKSTKIKKRKLRFEGNVLLGGRPPEVNAPRSIEAGSLICASVTAHLNYETSLANEIRFGNYKNRRAKKSAFQIRVRASKKTIRI